MPRRHPQAPARLHSFSLPSPAEGSRLFGVWTREDSLRTFRPSRGIPARAGVEQVRRVARSQPPSHFICCPSSPPLDPPSLCCVIPMLMLSPDLPCYRLTPCRPESGSAHACAECAGRSIRWGRTFRAGDRGTRGCALAQASKFWVLA